MMYLLAFSFAGAWSVAGAATWTFLNGDRLTGKLIDEDEETIEIQHEQLGRLRFAKSALATPTVHSEGTGILPDEKAAPSADTETVRARKSLWRRQLEFGFAQQSGTNSKEDLSFRLQVDGKMGDNTFRSTAQLLQSEANDQTVTDRRQADFRWRHDFSKRLFAQTLTTYAADDIRLIDLSLEQQLGGGYRVIDTRRHKANVGLGAVVQHLRREGLENETSLLGSVFQDYSYAWTDRFKLTQEANLLVSGENSFAQLGGTSSLPVQVDGSLRMRFNTALQSKVTSQVYLNIRYEYDYDRAVPDPDFRGDQRITTSLGYNW